MLDFGLVELGMIVVVAILVVGPKDIPKIMLALGRIMRRQKYVRYAFTQQFEDFLKEAELEDINKQVNFEARAEGEADFNEADEDEAYLDGVMEPLEPPQATPKKEDVS